MVASPLPDDELNKRADLVIEAHVRYRSNGKAAIDVKTIIKGTPRLQRQGWWPWLTLRRTVLVEYRSQPLKPVLGDWWNEDAFVPGNRIRAHLVWDDDAQCYSSVWWNGIKLLR